MKYRCMLERFIDVEADSEEEAQEKALLGILRELLEENEPFIIWEKAE